MKQTSTGIWYQILTLEMAKGGKGDLVALAQHSSVKETVTQVPKQDQKHLR